MPAQLQGLATGTKRLLGGFTSGQKAVLGVALVALLLGGFFFTSWAAKPALVPVFTNLASADAAAITEELTAKGTPYELADGGATVLVPQQDVYQLRLDLSAAGLPESGSSGYELLDQQGITTSEFRQRVDYQRALEGELSKTISSLDGVEQTTVHLVIPEQALFADDTRKPSASVLVKTRPGAALTGGQVQAVVNLVSSSVEGLEPGQVTLADSSGNVLSTAGADGAAAAAGDLRATQTSAFEAQLQASVQEMLAPVVGAGKAVVRVRADLDFDKRETRTERFETGRAPVVSETSATETYDGSGQVVGGVLGPENVTTPEGGESSYEKGSSSREYAVGKVTERAEAAPGRVERLSVAVILDAQAAGVVDPGEVKQLVSAAAGIDVERGDVVEVSRMAFDDSAAQAAEEEMAALEAAERSEQRWGLARTVAVLLVVGLVLLHALRVLRRGEQRMPVTLAVQELEARQQQAIAAEEAAVLAAQQRLQLEATPTDPDEVHRLTVQAEIGDMVERQPEEVAQLLRGWLADRRS